MFLYIYNINELTSILPNFHRLISGVPNRCKKNCSLRHWDQSSQIAAFVNFQKKITRNRNMVEVF